MLFNPVGGKSYVSIQRETSEELNGFMVTLTFQASDMTAHSATANTPTTQYMVRFSHLTVQLPVRHKQAGEIAK